MNVNAPPPHHLLSSLKHNVSTVPTKGQFTEAGSLVHVHKCSLWVLLVTRALVYFIFIYLSSQVN